MELLLLHLVELDSSTIFETGRDQPESLTEPANQRLDRFES